MIKDLQKNPLWQKAMAEVARRHRPIVPNFDPKNSISADEWKYKSGLQDGFDLLYLILTGEKDARSKSAGD